MEINLNEAKLNLGSLLDLTQMGEEVVIMRRGIRKAKLVPVSKASKTLPDLQAFRNSIRVKGESLGSAVVEGRNEERY